MPNDTYLTTLLETDLAYSRNVVAGVGLQAIDSGPLSTFNIQTTGILNSISGFSGTGFICKGKNNVNSQRLFANSATTTVTNPDGVGGNMQINVTNTTTLQNVQIMLNSNVVTGLFPTSYINFNTTNTNVDVTVIQNNISGNVTQDIYIANKYVSGTPSGANALSYYLVTQSTNAPVNAINLGTLGNGLLYQAVGGGVSTITPTNALTNTTLYFGATNTVRVGLNSGSSIAALDVGSDRASFWINQTASSITAPTTGGIFSFDNTGKLSLTTSNANNKSGQIVINSSGSTAVGDILRGNAAGIMQSLAIGSTGTVLFSNGTTPFWNAPTLPYGFNVNGVINFRPITFQTVLNIGQITGSGFFNTLISNTSATGNLNILFYIDTSTITFVGSSAETWCYFRVQSNLAAAPSSTTMVNSSHGSICKSGLIASYTGAKGVFLSVPVATIAQAGSTSLLIYMYTTSNDLVSSFDLLQGTSFKCTYFPSGML